jgi:hypothetical protein
LPVAISHGRINNVLFLEHILFNNFQGFDMKKTLIALAAIAAVGAASAQSTLYGVVDLGISKVTDKDAQISSGGYSTSRLGVKGFTDLGGGLKGSYMVETGFNAADGATETYLGNRGASAGISGSYGSLSLGRQFTPYSTSFWNEPLEYDGFTTFYFGRVQADHYWQSNSVLYKTPDMNGFTASAMYSGIAGDNFSAGTYFSVGGNYVTGPFTLDAGYESSKVTATNVTTTGWNVAGAYNAGFATLYAALQGGDNGGANKQSSWDLGAGIPLGDGMTAQLGYYSVKVVDTNSYLAAVLVKEWNKQTRLYGGFVTSSMKEPSTAKDSTTVKAGVRYSF